MDPLELLRGRNRHVLKLPSELWCKIVLPRVEECMAAGGVPLPLVMRFQRQIREEAVKAQVQAMRALGKSEDEIDVKVRAQKEPDVELTADEQHRIFLYQNELVRKSLKALAETEQDARDAEEIEFTPEMVAELDEPDWQQIVLWAGRDQPLPPKASTSTDSPASSDPSTDATSVESNGSGAETPEPASTT